MRIAQAAFGLGLALCLAAGPAAANSPEGKTYHVTVYSTGEGQFDDCFSFRKNGTLVVAGFGSLIYALDELNTQPNAWQALGVNPFGLAFHGTVGGAGAQTIQANAINDDGGTFILQGVLDRACVLPAAKRSGGSPYRG